MSSTLHLVWRTMDKRFLTSPIRMNLYPVSIPVFIKTLGNLKGILAKGQAYAREQSIPETEFLDTRLAPDMFPLTRQVQIASDAAKGIAAGLAGIDKPVMEDTEKTFDELMERCDKTITCLASLTPEQLEGGEDRFIPFPYVEGKAMTAEETLLQSSLPNFFFHVTIAYAILRHKGVPLGKSDYIGVLPLQ